LNLQGQKHTVNLFWSKGIANGEKEGQRRRTEKRRFVREIEGA